MKALVAGCGSIGRRHISNLIDSDRIEKIYLYTQNSDCLKGLEERGKVQAVDSLDSVESDFAVISNDTCKHIDTALVLAERGMDLFIEKPLAHSIDRVDLLQKIADAKGIKVQVGYNLRFLGIMEYINEQLANDVLGNLHFAKIEVGQYLPDWREGADYRDSYSASAERGGGVALDLSHELDYMRYFFGDPLKWSAMGARVGSLDMNADDVFEGIYLYGNKFICNVHMDCLQRNVKRYIRVEGERGSMVCDFIGKILTISTDSGEIVVNDQGLFDVHMTYVQELDHFMDVVENKTDPAINLRDGIEVLKLIKDGSA